MEEGLVGRSAAPVPERRHALARILNLGLVGSLAAAYGTFAAYAARFLYPAAPARRAWTYVTRLDQIPVGKSLRWTAPTGQTINVTRLGAGVGAADFVALSSVCPHLGCQVHWEAHHDRYFCPCHNGTFDPEGKPTGGPPKEGNTPLSRYPLEVRGQLVFIEVPTDALVARRGRTQAA
jgi:cytochrome b6-f complex iron-sulfur subunit